MGGLKKFEDDVIGMSCNIRCVATCAFRGVSRRVRWAFERAHFEDSSRSEQWLGEVGFAAVMQLRTAKRVWE